jgi:hypothetical protein
VPNLPLPGADEYAACDRADSRHGGADGPRRTRSGADGVDVRQWPARPWWNSKRLSGRFIRFHSLWNVAGRVSPWCNSFSPRHRFMKKVQICWCDTLLNVPETLETIVETGLQKHRVSAFFPLPNQTSPKFNLVSEKVYITFSPMGVRLHYPQPMKLFISPSELCKIDQITP